MKNNYIKWNEFSLYLSLLIAVIFAFSSIEYIYLMGENEDVNTLDKSDSDPINKDENTSYKEDTKRMTEFEHKVQKYMSMHMDSVLSDLRKDIASASDSSNKEDLEKAYKNEVDFKLEVDSLTSKLEKELSTNDFPSTEESQDKKRIAEESIDFKNKKTKE